MVITNKFRAPVGIRDLIIAEKPVDYVVHYLKIDTGPPSGGGITDECCLNIFDNIFYIYDGSNWNGSPLVNNQRFCFCVNGSVGTGNGINISTNYLYDFDGVNCPSKQASDGIVVLVKYKSYGYPKESLTTFDEISNQWIKAASSSSVTVTNEDIDDRVSALLQAGSGINLTYDDVGDSLTIASTVITVTNEDIDDRVAALLQAGSGINLTYDDVGDTLTISSSITVSDEDIDDRVSALLQEGEGINLTYNDAADSLTIECELAEGGNSTANKGVASFDNNSFSVTTGFVEIHNVNGGNF